MIYVYLIYIDHLFELIVILCFILKLKNNLVLKDTRNKKSFMCNIESEVMCLTENIINVVVMQ